MKTEKMLVVTIGYCDYAIPMSKAQALIDLLGAAPQVERGRDYKSYWLHTVNESVISKMVVGDVNMTTQPEPTEEE